CMNQQAVLAVVPEDAVRTCARARGRSEERDDLLRVQGDLGAGLARRNRLRTHDPRAALLQRVEELPAFVAELVVCRGEGMHQRTQSGDSRDRSRFSGCTPPATMLVAGQFVRVK